MKNQKSYTRLFAVVLIAICGFLSSPAPATAAMTPASLGVIPPVQFPSSEYSITGFRLSLLYGHHRDLYGLDLGLLGNITDQAFTGVAISGLFNVTKGNTTAIGLQLAGVTNVNTNKTKVIGLQLAGGVNYNGAESSVVGLQIAPVNISSFTSIYGAQIGIYNTAQDVYGVQIGLVNIAKSLHGIQIGLANINQTGLFYVAPILNVGF